MVELIILVVVLILGWGAFRMLASVVSERANLWARSSKADLQENYREVLTKIKDAKAQNGGTWHSLTELDEEMK